MGPRQRRSTHRAAFTTCYLIAPIVGWSAGRLIDEVHPTWIAISVLVVMWPNGQKSYQRVVALVIFLGMKLANDAGFTREAV